jgi:hypothetical protein
MRRAALLGITALLASLALTASAAADLPRVQGGSILGKDLPMKVYASISPAVHTFGSPLTARVAVLADRKAVAPANVLPIVHFAPYEPDGPPTVVQTSNGRLLQMTWTWKLRCLSVKCLPMSKKSDLAHIFRFSPAHVEYLSPDGQIRYAIDARFQRVAVVSELSPSLLTLLDAHLINWYYKLAPLPAAQYRMSPNLVFWLAVALAALLGGAGILIASRWALQFRPARAAKTTAATSSLERALTLFFWARANDDETLQRKALERVADELPFDVHELSETARALAWSPETPEEEDVEEISERAGIHRRNGESKP